MFWKRWWSDILPSTAYTQEFSSTEWKNSKTYSIDFDKKRIIGKCSEKEAMKQAILKALSTARYEYEIYDWNYGSEISTLLGKSISFCEESLEEYINDALLQDKRIISITDFSTERGRNILKAKFTVETIFGEIQEEIEVNI